MTENEILERILILKENIIDYHAAIDILTKISGSENVDRVFPHHILDKIERDLTNMRIKLAEVRGE